MNITTKPVEYFDGKQKCIGYLAWDESVVSARPCVLIGHAWGGRDSFAENKAIQMAAMGYVGFAIDVYGDGAQPDTMQTKSAAMVPFIESRKALLSRLKAGMKAAASLDEVDEGAMAMMGFCFGGLCALDLARSGVALQAAISFHGNLTGSDLPAKKIKSKVLVCHGWDDPMVPPEQVLGLTQEMTKAGCDWQLHAYGATTHAFTVPEANDKTNGLMYNADSARRSWDAAIGLLDEVFGASGLALG